MKLLISKYRNKRVDVYWNIRKRMFSVRSCETGKVIGHSPFVTVRNAELVVQMGGWMRAIGEGRRNVHAVVRGELIAKHQLKTKPPKAVKYHLPVGLFLDENRNAQVRVVTSTPTAYLEDKTIYVE